MAVSLTGPWPPYNFVTPPSPEEHVKPARKVAKVPTEADQILGTEDASLLDIVDNLLNKGVVLSGDITLGLAQVDLVYARVSLLLSAADRVLPESETESTTRRKTSRSRPPKIRRPRR